MQTMEAPRPALDMKTAAAYVGVSERTLKRYAAKGVVPVLKVGKSGAYRFREEHLAGMFKIMQPEGN